jgi:hypothetical protein
MRKRKILRSFLSRQKYENLFQEKVMYQKLGISPSYGGSLTVTLLSQDNEMGRAPEKRGKRGILT